MDAEYIHEEMDAEHIYLPPFLDYEEEMAAWKEEENILLHLYASNNIIIAQYLQEDDQLVHKGSVYGHIVRDRKREEGHAQLWNDYFSKNPTYEENLFRRRFRMRRSLYLQIVDAVKAHDDFFVQKKDGLGRLGLSTLQKVTSAFRMLAYGTAADSMDEYIRIGESTAILCIKKFCRAIVEIFGKKYLRSHNSNDIASLLKKGEERGFPGVLGSLDCMHWSWKNCPTAWAGQYSRRGGSPTIILEAVASHDLWIWHAYFGLPGSNNDINVLQSSNLFANLTQGIGLPAHYTIHGIEFNVGYYLADGIYPKWSTLVQTISKPQDPKKQHFAMMQEACRKDVERAFGVLQSRFAIVKGPARFWNKCVLHDIMSVCIIMHNMIVEDEGGEHASVINSGTPTPIPNVEMVVDETKQFQQFLARHKKIKDKEAHYVLRNALVEHLWERHGNCHI
ncbi:putative nuclease HARBI1 [Camellia sinensis]|uniref:putative nuclease HARBI1 n=1 Tax=Camellia sinensis TaxID=4442 RepID=UPI001035C439|nr:putative nuclease HARBI1 [Camellia sinensis]